MREKLASRGKELIHLSKTAEKVARLGKQLILFVSAYPLRDQTIGRLFRRFSALEVELE